MRRLERVLWATVFLFPGAAFAGEPAAPEQTAAITRAQIEADWLRQDAVRTMAASAAGVTPQEDAAGGCDGLKDGRWGFHTENEPNPWWQVDLGGPTALAHVVIYNRCDGGFASRAAHLIVLLSDDGKKFTEVYRHNGTVFQGLPDGKPLLVPLKGHTARFVRIQLPETTYLHLDEVEVYLAGNIYERNVALGRPATQSSTSQWSARHAPARSGKAPAAQYPVAETAERGLKLAASLRRMGVGVDAEARLLEEAAKAPASDASPDAVRERYFQIRQTVRKLALANPLLDFDRLLLVKSVPGTYSHMSDQNYGWWSRPGGGLFILEGFKTDSPKLRCITSSLPPGTVSRPDLSYDATKVVFAYCKYYPESAGRSNKVDKSKLPEDAFYHLYEMNLDGTGLKKLTHGKYDDFDPRYLPSGELVFLSTRRGQAVQCDKAEVAATLTGEQPDSYVRCGGGDYRPVAVYTLHVMDADGSNVRPISAFENFEWTPAVADDGRILYARWDYVDRNNHPYMSLWSTLPDGTSAQAVYGNFTQNPMSIFEARSVPNSQKLVFTASAHHSITAGSLALLDLNRGADGPGPITRLTPEVPFPEMEGWPNTYFVTPYPLSEEHFLTAWSDQPLRAEGSSNPPNALGIYLYDAFGNLTLICRDSEISCLSPLPVRPRPRPPAVSSKADWDGSQEGRMLLLDVYKGLDGIAPKTIRRLRLVGVPAKTQPAMNSPSIGVTREDPGKFVMGTVPVEDDGSAFFHVPSGVPFFLQALDANGQAIQTMRTVTYVQPGQTYTCVGCHEPRNTSPVNRSAVAALRQPSKIKPGPEGSFPLDYDVLVQPVLDKHCVRCHVPGEKGAQKMDFRPGHSYDTIMNYGSPSLQDQVLTGYRQGRSVIGSNESRHSVFFKLLKDKHPELTADDWDRVITWMDTYAQRSGSFSPDQEKQVRALRERMAPMLETPK
ncbi:MAG: HzsA-related protein [Pirellulales bacterium]